MNMRAGLHAGLLVCLGSVSGADSTSAQVPAVAKVVVAFVDVNVVPMDRERILPGQTVVVRDGRIWAIGPSADVAVPEGAQKIDGREKFLLPGLADMHVHLGPGAGNPGDPAGRALRLVLANGITTVRSMAGNPGQIILRDKLARGEILGPSIHVAGPALSGREMTTPEAARQAVLDQKKAGYDFIKVLSGFSADVYAAIVEAAREAGLRVAGHVDGRLGLTRAIEAHQGIEHLDGYLEALVKEGSRFRVSRTQIDPGRILYELDESKLPSVIAAVRAAGIWNCPTLALMKRAASEETAAELAARPEMRYMPAQAKASWTFQREIVQGDPPSPEERRRWLGLRDRIVKGLDQVGAKLLAGSDSPQAFSAPGFALHRELGTLVEAGLTPYAAIAAATRNAAEYMNALDEFGTVGTGKRADLLLVDGNPLENVGHLTKRTGVMARGRWLTESDLQAMLEEVAKAAQAPPVRP